MKIKNIAFFSLAFFLLCAACKKPKPEAAQAPGRELPASEGTFPAVVAGQFYPADPGQLRTMIQGFLSQARVAEIPARIFAVLSPHAGYIFSGPIAGYSYRALQSQGSKKFVIIAPSHHYPGAGQVAVLNADYYQTPLGKVKINRDKVRELYGLGDWVTTDPRYFSEEHAAEVQLPFLQTIVGDGLEVVLIVMPDPSLEMTQKLAQGLLKVFPGEDWVFIASSDMSHYHSNDQARQIDRNTLNLLEQMDISRLYQEGMGTARTAELCGIGPVLTVMQAFKTFHSGTVKILAAKNSFETTQANPERVVGYGAALFLLPSGATPAPASSPAEVEELKPYGGDLTLDEKKELMKLARYSVETYVREDRIPEVEVKHPRLKELGAAFVTLTERGQLRGWIGHVIAREPLYLCVRDVACSAAKQDPRFPPVTAGELKDLDYEISLLSPLAPVKDLTIIKVGRDGLVMRMGPYQGLLLPQVPVEQGWDREAFLSHTCNKAGMGSNCWSNPEVQILRFQGLVFKEKDLK